MKTKLTFEKLDNKPDWPIVSTTMLESWKRCPRYFAWRYIAHIQGEPSASVVLGRDVHKILAQYITDGTMPEDTKAGKVASGGLHLLPPPKERTYKVWIEEPLYFKFEDTNYMGIVDYLDLFKQIIFDHKTTSDFKWVKTQADLMEDTQAILYTAIALAWKLERPALAWIYYKTRGKPEGRRVDVPEISGFDEKFLRLHEESKQLLDALNTISNPLQLPCNVQGCGLYGGCEYQSYCSDLTTTERIKSAMAQLSIKERLEQLKLKQQSQAGLPEINPPQEQEEIAEPEEVEEKPRKQRVKKQSTKNKAEQPVVEDVSQKEEEEIPQAVVKPVKGFTLYQDCYPLKSKNRDILYGVDLIMSIGVEVAKAHHVPIYRLLEYAEGSNKVAAILKDRLAEGFERDIFVETYSIAKAILEVLQQSATVVIKGL